MATVEFHYKLFFVYHVIRDDKIIYVGVTRDPNQRIKGQKRRFGNDIVLKVVFCCGWDEVYKKEKREILKLFNRGVPLYNSAYCYHKRPRIKKLLPGINPNKVNLINQKE